MISNFGFRDRNWASFTIFNHRHIPIPLELFINFSPWDCHLCSRIILNSNRNVSYKSHYVKNFSRRENMIFLIINLFCCCYCCCKTTINLYFIYVTYCYSKSYFRVKCFCRTEKRNLVCPNGNSSVILSWIAPMWKSQVGFNGEFSFKCFQLKITSIFGISWIFYWHFHSLLIRTRTDINCQRFDYVENSTMSRGPTKGEKPG